MRQPIRVLQWGLGAMGRRNGAPDAGKNRASGRCHGGWSARFVGKDLGEVLGLDQHLGMAVTDRPEEVLDKTRWTSFRLRPLPGRRIRCPIFERFTAGINCMTIAEEMADPEPNPRNWPPKSSSWQGKQVFPFWVRALTPALCWTCLLLPSPEAAIPSSGSKPPRVNDLSPYGPTVMKSQGVGTTLEVPAGVADGTIVGHVGFPELIHLISEALGLGVDRIEQSRQPIISKVFRETPHVKV